METCSYSERLLPALLDGELSGPLRREVGSHVAGCVTCTRESTAIEQIQELVRDGLDDAVERIDFSDFLEGVMDQLDTSQIANPSWTVRFRLWCETWRFRRPHWLPEWTGSNVWTGFVGATAAIALLLNIFPILPLSQTAQIVGTDSPPPITFAPKRTETFEESALLVLGPTSSMDNQAQIESLTATTTVFLWSEPISNTTVIWVGYSGAMP